MNIEKISPNKKNNLKIASVGAMYGLLQGGIAMSFKDVAIKDVFQYRNLSATQKKAVKTSGIIGLISAFCMGILIKIASKENTPK